MNPIVDTAERADAAPSAASPFHLLPVSFLELSVLRLPIAQPLANLLCAQGITTVNAMLSLPSTAFEPGAWLGPHGAVELRSALGGLLHGGLAQLAPAPAQTPSDDDWSHLEGKLMSSVAEEARPLLRELLGLDGHAVTLAELVRRGPHDGRELEQIFDAVRSRLQERLPNLLCTLRHEIGMELQAFDGLVDGHHLALGSLLHSIASGAGDPRVALRLSAFCFPHDFHLHADTLVGLSPRRFRHLIRQLRRLVQPHRLPLPIDTLLTELAAEQAEAPRGLIVHLLRSELRIAIEICGDHGEVAIPDPRSAGARLADLLAEVGEPTSLEDLVFAYREHFRRASRASIEQRLRRDPMFVMVGPNRWALRAWHQEELAAVTPLVDKVARRLCAEGGKQNVAALLAQDAPDDRTLWLVLDRLAQDPRVRLLGRGEACPATHTRSQVLDQLMQDFRRAAGDVVTSMFVANQPASHQRLVKRLLHENRLFVIPSEDRIDVLSNYPFNAERLQRLLTLVAHQLNQRTGYAQVSALKAAIDRTDLGGSWLTPTLLTDILRRHGPFEVLPGELIGRAELGLSATLMRTVRQALRESGEPVSVEEILRARPELVEFAACLSELLSSDPLVQTPDGSHFTLV
jgi:hypothetical protein